MGSPLKPSDPLPPAIERNGVASFDLPSTTTPLEYAGWGAGLYVEPAIKATFPDGNRDLVLHYVAHHIEGNSLIITLKDIQRELFVDLHYTVYSETGIIGRSATISNRTATPVTLDEAAAATWNLERGDDYTLRYLGGRWAGEWHVNKQPIQAGETVLESKRGSTGRQNNPWFAIERGSHPDEESGDVWFGALAWSGSWRIAIEQDQLKQIRITGGFNPFDFAYNSRPASSLRPPSSAAASRITASAGLRGCCIDLNSAISSRPHPRQNQGP